ncbi:MAG: SDR family oxidoreductase [Promethearchaeota archaeon]
MDLKLKNRLILVTGASKGLGFACSKLLCEENADVVISSRSNENLEKASEQIYKITNKKPDYFQADVSKLADIQKLKEFIIAKYKKIDGLIINTGGPRTGPVLDIKEENWKKAIETNFLSTIRLTKAFLPTMIKQNFGRIVAITSISAKMPLQNLVLSNSTRLGVIGFIKTISNEFGKYNIIANSVLPGYTLTERLNSVMQSWANSSNKTLKQVIQEKSQEIPLGRLAQPEEFASLVIYLISPRNSYITGQAISIDGGLSKYIF